MKFAMLICGDDDEWSALPPAEEEDVMKQVYGWFERWQPTGKIADGGVELQPRQTARTIRQRRGRRQPVVTDGPYLELKEVIGGVVILEATRSTRPSRSRPPGRLAAGMSAHRGAPGDGPRVAWPPGRWCYRASRPRSPTRRDISSRSAGLVASSRARSAAASASAGRSSAASRSARAACHRR